MESRGSHCLPAEFAKNSVAFRIRIKSLFGCLIEGVRLKCGSGCGTDGVKMRNGTDMGLKCGTDMGLKRGTERIWG